MEDDTVDALTLLRLLRNLRLLRLLKLICLQQVWESCQESRESETQGVLPGARTRHDNFAGGRTTTVPETLVAGI